MYVTAYITLDTAPDGDAEEYEVGAYVSYEPEGPFAGHEVGEPDVSAPDCRLKFSRLINQDSLPVGWSDMAELALIEAYEGAIGDMLDARGDYERDRYDREDY
jgi:hypothetical protein